MPDITKCHGDGCPLRDDCYRYTSRPSERQPYFIGTPGYWLTEANCTIESERGKWDCDHYMPVGLTEKRLYSPLNTSSHNPSLSEDL